jgi:gas vesicle protein
MKNNSKVLIALASGIAVGGLLGLLFAPNKGSETRKKIIGAEKKLTNSIKETVTKGKEKFSELKDGMKEKIEALNEKVKEYI